MKTGFFEESEGVRSVTRLVFAAGCFWALAAASVMVWRGVDPLSIGAFIGSVVAVFGGTKVASGALTEKEK